MEKYPHGQCFIGFIKTADYTQPEKTRPTTAGSNPLLTLLPDPIENTLTISTNEGELTTLNGEGGKPLAVEKKHDTYTLSFSLLHQNNINNNPFECVDGVSPYRYTFLIFLIPQYASSNDFTACQAWLLDNCLVTTTPEINNGTYRHTYTLHPQQPARRTTTAHTRTLSTAFTDGILIFQNNTTNKYFTFTTENCPTLPYQDAIFIPYEWCSLIPSGNEGYKIEYVAETTLPDTSTLWSSFAFTFSTKDTFYL